MLKSNFVRNVLVLLSGSTLAQLITFLTLPILSRIFSPEDFGSLAMFASVVTIISAVSTCRYDYASMLPEEDESAFHLIALSFSTLALTLIMTLIALIFWPQKSYWAFWIPCGVLLVATIQILSSWMNRRKKYKSMAKNHIARAITYPSTTLALKYNTSINKGLLFGYLTAQLVHALLFVFQVKKEFLSLAKKLSLSSLKFHAKKYKNFPLHNLPAHLLSILSFQVPLLLLGTFFSSSVVGQYSQSLQILFAPINLIGLAISKVFYQQATLAHKNKQLFNLVKKTSLFLAALGIIPTLIVGIWGKPLFMIFLGNNWGLAGEISQLLIPYFLLRFIFFSQISVFSITNKTGTEALINLLLLLSQIGSILVGFYYFNSIHAVMVGMAVTSVLIYLSAGITLIHAAARK